MGDFLSSWMLEVSNFVHAWNAQNKTLGMKWDILISVYLHDRYHKYFIFFPFSSHYWDA